MNTFGLLPVFYKAIICIMTGEEDGLALGQVGEVGGRTAEAAGNDRPSFDRGGTTVKEDEDRSRKKGKHGGEQAGNR